jgi:hypothetical protein
MVFVTTPSRLISTVSAVQFRVAMWKSAAREVGERPVRPFEHGALPGVPSSQPHLVGSPESGVPGSFQMWTWLGRSKFDISWSQVVFCRLQSHMLQEGPPAGIGCLSGPHVPFGSGGQPVRHLVKGVVEHLSGL